MVIDRPDLLPPSVARTIAAVAPVLRTLAAIDRGQVVPLPNPVPDYLRAKVADMKAVQDRYYADPARVERDRFLAEAAARRFAEWNKPSDLPSPGEQAANALEGKP